MFGHVFGHGHGGKAEPSRDADADRPEPRSRRGEDCLTRKTIRRRRVMVELVSNLGSTRTRYGGVRIATVVLAFAHWFPASKHVVAFFAQPSLDEAWKAVGASLAVALYLAPPAWQARAIARLWHRQRGAFSALSLVLLAVHAVAVIDHLPRFWSHASWEDGWRAIGASLAMAWFTAPLAWQHRALARLARLPSGASPKAVSS